MSPRGGQRPGSGRPRGRKPPGPFLHIRISEAQDAAYRAAAHDAGMEVSTWVRRTLDGASTQ